MGGAFFDNWYYILVFRCVVTLLIDLAGLRNLCGCLSIPFSLRGATTPRIASGMIPYLIEILTVYSNGVRQLSSGPAK